jgi:hypothetical protein
MKKIVLRGLRSAVRLTFTLTLALALNTTPQTATAKQIKQIIVVGNDRGGLIGERARTLEWINASRAQVEIRGGICYSACTMYLGAENVCISPATVFGFHGPSRRGRALPASEFEHWSKVMAHYYPDGLRQWFLQTARYSGSSVMQVNGSDLIKAGYASC